MLSIIGCDFASRRGDSAKKFRRIGPLAGRQAGIVTLVGDMQFGWSRNKEALTKGVAMATAGEPAVLAFLKESRRCRA